VSGIDANAKPLITGGISESALALTQIVNPMGIPKK
jgi:hypothetical protein